MCMKKIILLSLCFLLTICCLAKTKATIYEYEIVGVTVAKEGYYLVEVSAMVDTKKNATLESVKKCAIHGCLFKGFVMERIAQKPIIASPLIEQEHQEFFTHLINERFEQYTNGSESLQIVKVGKRFRVKAIVAVAKEMLRKDLEDAGIIRKLGL